MRGTLRGHLCVPFILPEPLVGAAQAARWAPSLLPAFAGKASSHGSNLARMLGTL